ncbi:methyltransferase type 11 [Truncatella angustata]|uniref:Methyltransferase type 11 n=1 Tax=Truncatella angustata TaxID=152316 RepID=A0A9P8UC54_9PEZI|nr:methyltransferase type 11 [Truncatella angustata]KAH6645352.1 methyltransferase type 11 [Truncatella angustata]
MAPGPRLANFLRPLSLIWFSIRLHWAAFKESYRQNGLGALGRIPEIRDAALAKLFCITSDGFIAFEDKTIIPSLLQAASGVVLELGPGPGNQIHRFDMSRVSQVYGIEPNSSYKDGIKTKVEKHNLGDKYKLIISGIEDSQVLRAEGITEGSLDTVLCIQVLCAVKDPKTVMKEIWKLLKPGGKFIFWEHGWSRSHLTAVEQAVLNPAWSTFIGCHMTRNVLADIINGGEWENPEDIEEPEDLVSCLPRIQGVLVKKA